MVEYIDTWSCMRGGLAADCPFSAKVGCSCKAWAEGKGELATCRLHMYRLIEVGAGQWMGTRQFVHRASNG